MSDLIRTRDSFLDKLDDQQSKRWKYKGTEWILAECQLMFELVNQERRERRLSPVTMAEIERVERCACGLSDYSSKFALYCAELAISKPEKEP